jgi:hypothetical protein
MPAGFWASSCGPVMNPSSDIAMDSSVPPAVSP